MVVLFLQRFILFSIAPASFPKASPLELVRPVWISTRRQEHCNRADRVLSRVILKNEMFQFVNIAYSLVLTVGELFLGSFFFTRRHSEVAEHGAKNAKVQTLFACLLILPVVLLFSSGVMSATWQNILLVFALPWAAL
jgi:hypothetical protein